MVSFHKRVSTKEFTPKNIFTSLLRDRQSREVNVSKAFEACFVNSSTFRSKVLQLIAVACGVCSVRFSGCDWQCETEIVRDHGRLDLLLSPSNRRLKKIILENKVGAPLTREQMLRYRKGESEQIVIALTKRYPEPGRTWLKKNGCLSLRWQDVHRALAAGSDGHGTSAFLCRSFREYLEEIDMAYKGEVTKRDLDRIERLFRVARSHQRQSELRAAPAFRAALNVLELLDEVQTAVTEAIPEMTTWGRWGPTYFKYRADDQDYHHFAFRLKKQGWQQWCGAGFEFPSREKGEIQWLTHTQTKHQDEPTERRYGSKLWTSRAGTVNTDALARLFRRDVRRSGLTRIRGLK